MRLAFEVANLHDLARGVDGDDLVGDSDVEVQIGGQARRCLDEQLVAVGDVPADVVRHAAVGEGHVRVTFQDHDVGVLGQPSGTCCRRHPACHTTDNNDPLGSHRSSLSAGAGRAGSGSPATGRSAGFPIVNSRAVTVLLRTRRDGPRKSRRLGRG